MQILLKNTDSRQVTSSTKITSQPLDSITKGVVSVTKALIKNRVEVFEMRNKRYMASDKKMNE